jgi:hypothetical protein
MPEPLNRLAEIISHIDEILEPLLAKKSSGLRRGKTGKLSSKGRKGAKNNGDQSSLAFSGMTIRGNMFQGSAEEFLNEQK